MNIFGWSPKLELNPDLVQSEKNQSRKFDRSQRHIFIYITEGVNRKHSYRIMYHRIKE